jgi:hypothetical protein
LDTKGRTQFATYTTESEKEKDKIVSRERKKPKVIAIQVGSTYVYKKNS